jgi:hypothetical protein
LCMCIWQTYNTFNAPKAALCAQLREGKQLFLA